MKKTGEGKITGFIPLKLLMTLLKGSSPDSKKKKKKEEPKTS